MGRPLGIVVGPAVPTGPRWRHVQRLRPRDFRERSRARSRRLARPKPAYPNPATQIPKLREEETARREFRTAEIDLLLPTLTGEWRGIFLLGLYTGQRLNDLAELRWRNVDLEKKTVAFTARMITVCFSN